MFAHLDGVEDHIVHRVYSSLKLVRIDAEHGKAELAACLYEVFLYLLLLVKALLQESIYVIGQFACVLLEKHGEPVFKALCMSDSVDR